MTGQYKLVPLKEALPGMVLSDDVLDMRGHILLAAGVVLTETILASLRHHHVSLLSIVAENISETDQQTEISGYEARLKHLFRIQDINGDDATSLLEQHVRRFRLGDPE